jgi:hydrogenase expression/formation protein HypC
MCLAVPGRVLEVRVEHGTRMATVDFGGVTKQVCLEYVPEVEVGDYTIVHAGFAITRLDESAALDSLATFRAAGLLDEEPGGEGSAP